MLARLNRWTAASYPAAPVRMLARVCAPAQALGVEVLRVTEEVPQLRKKLSDTCRSRKTVMCLRPHCGQRVRTVYLAPDFAVSSHAGEDFIFVTLRTTCRVSRAPNRPREPLLNLGRCPQVCSLARRTPAPVLLPIRPFFYLDRQSYSYLVSVRRPRFGCQACRYRNRSES